MWTEIALGLVAFWYFTLPGDETGRPYPTTEPEIRREIVTCQEWLKDTEYEFARIEAHREVVRANAPLSRDALRVTTMYREQKELRDSIRYRIKNLKKLLGKYEEINNQFDNNKRASRGISGTRTSSSHTVAVDDRTVRNAEATIDIIHELDAVNSSFKA